MKYHRRILERRFGRLADLFPVVAVLGARQVGKSTLLDHVVGTKAKKFVFDPIDDMYGAREDPDFFLDQNPPPLILDEIQYATELLPPIKRRVDESPEQKGQYYLSGSHSLSVLKDISESMSGRVGILELSAMTPDEWSDRAAPDGNGWLSRWLEGESEVVDDLAVQGRENTPLTQRVWRGLMPGLLEFPNQDDTPEFHRSYIMTYIERDVRRTAEVADINSFRRFMGLLAALTAQEVNYSKLGREVGITRATAHRWLGVLQATYQWVFLAPYHGNVVKRLTRHAKGHLHDTGLACHLQGISSPDALLASPLFGRAYETHVVTTVMKRISAMAMQPTCYHWSTHAGAEVDLVLEKDGRLWPFECKAGTRITRHDASGIRAFRDTYPGMADTPGAIIAPVPEVRRLTPDIWVLPCDLL